MLHSAMRHTLPLKTPNLCAAEGSWRAARAGGAVLVVAISNTHCMDSKTLISQTLDACTITAGGAAEGGGRAARAGSVFERRGRQRTGAAPVPPTGLCRRRAGGGLLRTGAERVPGAIQLATAPASRFLQCCNASAESCIGR